MNAERAPQFQSCRPPVAALFLLSASGSTGGRWLPTSRLIVLTELGIRESMEGNMTGSEDEKQTEEGGEGLGLDCPDGMSAPTAVWTHPLASSGVDPLSNLLRPWLDGKIISEWPLRFPRDELTASVTVIFAEDPAFERLVAPAKGLAAEILSLFFIPCEVGPTPLSAAGLIPFSLAAAAFLPSPASFDTCRGK